MVSDHCYCYGSKSTKGEWSKSTYQDVDHDTKAKTNANEKTYPNFDLQLKSVFHFFDQNEDGILKHASIPTFQEMSKASIQQKTTNSSNSASEQEKLDRCGNCRKLYGVESTIETQRCVVTFGTLKNQAEPWYAKGQERQSSYQKKKKKKT
ncbi:hypothetical protein RFI_39121 [Reticulomyxa filosa]|uniref:Uncharacterized protein n=1 Tax=Reticulomyxa filosa TaxID=46433 RepID=X6LCF6_RETFI|nr:hypothetical protein RFI_39121 [Reticulomyxa filosa]|eukprot:ETN98389.1 hypothetical protein RFI_39121 [Reticulomyxa filosa]